MSTTLLRPTSSANACLRQGLPDQCWARLSHLRSQGLSQCRQRAHIDQQRRLGVLTPATNSSTSMQLDTGPSEPQRRVIRSDFVQQAKEGVSLYLVVLNYTLPRATAQLWDVATLRVCADGGANRLYDELPAMLPKGSYDSEEAARKAHLPDLIRGDMDSVRPDVLEFYKSHGVVTEDLSADQDSTDLTKCITYLDERLHSSENASSSAAADGASGKSAESRQSIWANHNIVVLGAIGGRLDHTLANLNTLYNFPHLNITLWGHSNLVRLLPCGKCIIQPDPALEGPSCALVPMAGPVTATSKGLKWDCHNIKLSFRGLISTSNLLDSSTVEVECDDEILWMTECANDELPAAQDTQQWRQQHQEELLN